jgi:hypothetical protein
LRTEVAGHEIAELKPAIAKTIPKLGGASKPNAVSRDHSKPSASRSDENFLDSHSMLPTNKTKKALEMSQRANPTSSNLINSSPPAATADFRQV